MQLEAYFDFLDPDDIRIKGHRIGIDQVIAYWKEGYSPEAIAEEFPGLSLEKVYATITYYLHNQSEIDASMARLAAWREQRYQEWAASPSSLVQRLRALKEQRQPEQLA